MLQVDSVAQIEAVRRFNRFYTRRIGVLEEGLLNSPFTLAQARVLFELGTRESVTAGELIVMLGLDPGYLSRILQGFVNSRLLARKRSAEDRRRTELSLTAKGRRAFGEIDGRSRNTIGEMISPLSPAERERLLGAMHSLEKTLSWSGKTRDVATTVRPYRIGDVGWAIEQHGRLYAEEFGWNGEFEALVATLFARFATHHDPKAERFWVAEVDGERVGGVFVVRNERDPRAAQLRCLLVDPKGRGLGLGRRLVDECIHFAKSAGYERMLLWTNDVLVAARRIYEGAGFSLVEESPHHSFGHDLVGQIWERALMRP
ncbi:MAG TPA: helix-turn-helix domain-containing GNAT family N-acetyltransferase [Steroidobacteraceae bacterium]|nr:helix-turn-helix domain-containing GNAT family N-acetyltransferase [Steroidobacteraceae bacterium]